MFIGGHKNIAVKQLSEDKHGLNHASYGSLGNINKSLFYSQKENFWIRDFEKNLSIDT